MESVCRTCLRTQLILFPLEEHQDLIYKIQTIASIQLIDTKGYPYRICQECVANVNKLFNFRKVLINSDLELQERFAALEHSSKTHIINKLSDEEELAPNVKLEADENEERDSPSLELNNHFETSGSDVEYSIKKSTIIRQITTGDRSFGPVKRCSCHECGKEFTSRFKLYNHRRTVHVIPGICNICGIIVRADNLRRHVQLHSEGPAKCHHCGKSFKNSESLRGHLLIHKGHTFTCEKCGKTSKVRAEHRRHMKTHTDPELGKVMCTICGKKVRDLKKHMHSHTGERPHVCSYCSKGFTSPYALKVHTRQHTNEKPYICHLCPIAFPQKVSLVTHLKSKHSEDCPSESL